MVMRGCTAAVGTAMSQCRGCLGTLGTGILGSQEDNSGFKRPFRKAVMMLSKSEGVHEERAACGGAIWSIIAKTCQIYPILSRSVTHSLATGSMPLHLGYGNLISPVEF